MLRAELERSFDAALLTNAEHAAGALAQDIDGAGRLQPSRRLIEQLGATGGRVVVFDSDGIVLADSAPATSAPLAIGPADLSDAAAHARVVRTVDSGGDLLRLTVEPILAPSGSVLGYVAWADSTRAMRQLLSTVGLALVAAGGLVTAAALAGGLVLARRALTPIADVTETARAISLSGDFAARVEAGQPGDEVGDLALAFNEMLAALEENHTALQRFLGDASHQLRTPLTSILANLELAQRHGLPDEERLAILVDARDEAERMGRLIGDLLSLARAESGARLQMESVELDALLVESVRRHRQASPHVRLVLTEVQPVLVDGDRDRLRELIGILLDNAARYTPAGGRVAAGLEARDGQATIVVADTGIGLDENDRAHVFERLYRGARARAMRPSGTGLGLAIARWIVDAHGGTIRLESGQGGGTVATVTLPARTT